jgi:hypothetical protein
MSERTEQRGDPEIGVCHVCGQTFETQLALSEHLDLRAQIVIRARRASISPDQTDQRPPACGRGLWSTSFRVRAHRRPVTLLPLPHQYRHRVH